MNIDKNSAFQSVDVDAGASGVAVEGMETEAIRTPDSVSAGSDSVGPRTAAAAEDNVDDAAMIRLEHKELWDRFDGYGTEMVITKSGR